MVNLTKTPQQVLFDDVVDKKLPRAGLKTLLDEMIAAVTALDTLTVVSVSGNTDVTADDARELFHATATATLSLVAAATAASGFEFDVLADGAAVTIDPDGAEQVNGATTLVIPAGHYARVRCTGSAWRAEVWPTTAARDPLIVTDQNTTLTAAQNRATVIGTGAMALTLPAATDAKAAFWVKVIGKGGAVTVTRAGTDTIDGETTLEVADGAAAVVHCTGSGWTAHVFGSAGGAIRKVSYVQDGAVATGTTLIPYDDTIPQITEGDEYLSLAFTPTSASSVLMIEAVVHAAVSTGGFPAVAIFEDGVNDAIGAAFFPAQLSADSTFTTTARAFVLAGSTSARTYKVRAGTDRAGTFTVNGRSAGRLFGGKMISSLTVTEFAT